MTLRSFTLHFYIKKIDFSTMKWYHYFRHGIDFLCSCFLSCVDSLFFLKTCIHSKCFGGSEAGTKFLEPILGGVCDSWRVFEEPSRVL